MKRTLSLVLALVMLLGTIPVFAAEVDERIAFLEAEGLLKGNTAGDLMLENELKRQDSVVVLARLLGLEEAAMAYEGEFPWEDAKADTFYFGFLAWAYEEGLYKGHSDEKFGFNETITANDFALVLLRALGYGDTEWEDAFEKAEELGLVEGLDVEATDKLLRSNMAIMMYLALGTEMAEGGKTLAEELEVVMPGVEMTLAATGAKKLTVTFNKDAKAATLVVTKGNVTVNLDGAPVWAADGKSAVITTVTNLTKGEYTVTATGVSEEALVAKVTVEDVKVTDIVIGDKAPLKALNDYTEAKLSYKVLNQYGEEMTSFGSGIVNWSASAAGGITGSTFGEKTLISGSTPFIPGSKVYVNVVFTNAAAGYSLVKNAEVEIVLPAQVDAIVFAGVARTGGNAFVALPSGFRSDAYVLAFTAYDQYGNKMTLSASAQAWENVSFVSNNPLFVGATFNAGENVTVGGVSYQTVKLVPGSQVDNGGTVTIQAISQRTGKISSYTIQADALARVNSFTMSAPSTLVAGNDSKVEIPFVAMDQFNNQITKFASLNGKVNFTPEYRVIPEGSDTYGLRFEQQANGDAKLYFYPRNNTSNMDVIEFLTSTVPTNGNFSNITVNVRPNATPEVVVGLKPAVATSVAVGARVEIKGSDVLVQDQYGRTMNTTTNPFPAKAIRVSATTGSAFIFDETTNAFSVDFVNKDSSITLTANTATTAANTRVLKFEVLDNDSDVVEGSARNVTFTRVAQTSFVSYKVADMGTLYTDPLTHKAYVEVYGVTASGAEVLLPASSVRLNLSAGLAQGVDTVEDLRYVTAVTPSALGITPTTREVTTSIIVTVMDERSSEAAVTILEKEFKVSDIAPKATTYKLATSVVNGQAFITAIDRTSTTSGAISNSSLNSFITEVLDQYGVDYDVLPVVTISNLTKASTSSQFTVVENISADAEITGAYVGDKFTATYRYGTLVITIDFTVSSNIGRPSI